MTDPFRPPRRRVLQASGLALAGTVFAPAVLLRPASSQERSQSTDRGNDAGKSRPEITPPEDLMREHGVLDRVLLVYEASMRRVSANEAFDPALVTRAADIIREFIHDYHEKSEEQHVFPRFRRAGQQVGLVDVLQEQHDAGRRVTATILQLAPDSRRDGDGRRRMVQAMQSFITMYRPHAAREDTELFPKLRDLVSSNEYDAIAEEMEQKEHQLFGDDGFETMVQRVAQLERGIGIDDLRQFTPREGGTDATGTAR